MGVGARLVENSEIQLPPETATGQTCAGVAQGEFIKVVITDSGIGLKREDLDRIFDPFDQVETSMSRRFEGTGLGLALTKSLVAIHGGSIWAESEGLGKGSRFIFITPVPRKN